MNIYGGRAMGYWRRFRPQAFQTIPNPQEFFSTLGEQIAEQVQMLADQLAGPDTPDEGYLGKVGRLNNATMRAEDMAMAELVYSTPPEDEDKGFEDPGMTVVQEWGREERALREQFQQEDEEASERDWRERTGQAPLP